jgi:hypothetical protein
MLNELFNGIFPGGLLTLGNEMSGYFIPGQYEIKENDASKTPRQLFSQVDAHGNPQGQYFFDPYGSFIDMTKGDALNGLLGDPDTFNPKNPSNFEPSTFNIFQKFKDNKEGLKKYFHDHPEQKIYKQETGLI